MVYSAYIKKSINMKCTVKYIKRPVIGLLKLQGKKTFIK